MLVVLLVLHMPLRWMPQFLFLQRSIILVVFCPVYRTFDKWNANRLLKLLPMFDIHVTPYKHDKRMEIGDTKLLQAAVYSFNKRSQLDP